jgi:serine O-acetyltransferase
MALTFPDPKLDIAGSGGIFQAAMEKVLNEVFREILASYESVGGLSNTDSLNLPSKRAIGDICEDLLQLLFPGFHDEEAIHKNSLSVLTRHRLTSVIDRLEEEVCKSLRIGDPECPTAKAREIALGFAKALPSLREVLKTDTEAAYEGDPAALSYEEVILSYPFIETISIQRMAHILYKAEVPLIPRMMTEWAHARTGMDIHPGAQIGSHFFIDHGTGVVIGETCRIGSKVKLYHGVTLGARSFAKDDSGKIVKGGKRHPEVEDGVTIYPNSTILGGETVIGKNSTIGANVFLMHSVPTDSLVIYEERQLTILNKNARKPEALEWFI